MHRFATATGFAVSAAAATLLLAPVAGAAPARPAPTASSAAQQKADHNLLLLSRSGRVVATIRPAAPTVSASPVPSRPGLQLPARSAVPSPVQSDGRGGIDVPAGRADVTSSGHDSELVLVALVGGGALLLAGGTVVAVARRRS